MGLTNLNECRKYLHIELPGITDSLTDQFLNTIAVEFFKKTQAWKCDLDTINLKAEVAEYDLDGVPSYAFLDTVTLVTWNDRVLKPSEDYVMPSRTVIRLVNEPAEDELDALDVQVCLRPRREKMLIPSDLFDEWHEVIEAGVKYLLMIMKGKKWSNPELGMYYKKIYWDGISSARIRENRGRMNSSIVASSPWRFE